ncbi:hypothetical protein GIB67_041468, partial [Kingdonia uniflora]
MLKTQDENNNHRKLSYEDIQMATNSFKDEIGRGGSGSVSRGVSKDGTLVAVKQVLLWGSGDLWRFEDKISRLVDGLNSRVRENEVDRHFWSEVFREMIIEPEAQKTVVREIAMDEIAIEDERILGGELIRCGTAGHLGYFR